DTLLANRAFLCVAGVPTAWRNLPEDFVQRLSAQHPIVMLSLHEDETRAVIATYLGHTVRKDKPVDDRRIYPFLPDSISEIVALSRGNVRSILGLCYRSFELASPQKRTIDAALIKQAALSLEKPVNANSVLDQAVLLLQEAGLSYERDVTWHQGFHNDII